MHSVFSSEFFSGSFASVWYDKNVTAFFDLSKHCVVSPTHELLESKETDQGYEISVRVYADAGEQVFNLNKFAINSYDYNRMRDLILTGELEELKYYIKTKYMAVIL